MGVTGLTGVTVPVVWAGVTGTAGMTAAVCAWAGVTLFASMCRPSAKPATATTATIATRHTAAAAASRPVDCLRSSVEYVVLISISFFLSQLGPSGLVSPLCARSPFGVVTRSADWAVDARVPRSVDTNLFGGDLSAVHPTA